MTSIHDLTEDVLKITIRYLFISAKIVMDNITADSQITIIEIILSRPTLTSELGTSEDQRMEHTKTKENSFEILFFVSLGLVKVFLWEFTESSLDVRFNITRSFVGNLKR
jgi:hypothetical protein